MKQYRTRNFVWRYILICAAAALLSSVSLEAEAIVINEVCSSNASFFVDAQGEYPDWIELYNPDDEAVDLSDVYISDDDDALMLFQLDGHVIEPQGFLVLRADDMELPFKLSATGCFVSLCGVNGEMLSAVEVPPLDENMSFSAQNGGSYQLTAPTPGYANEAGVDYVEPPFVASPVFSHQAGFYLEPFEMTLEGYGKDRVYYTLDGSEPGENSTLYTTPIYIENANYKINKLSARTDISVKEVFAPKVLQPKCVVVRAVAVDDDGNRSRTVTNAYFVGMSIEDGMQGISILSLVPDPADMFDPENGIYVRGKRFDDWLTSESYDPTLPVNNIPANYRIHGRSMERPVSVQWFDKDGNIVLDQDLGIRINGNFSRHDPQKSFKLYARKEYDGTGTIHAQFWPDTEKTKKVIVRNGGNNHVLMFLDSFAHELLSERSLPYSRSTPCLVFLDGEYWGLYNFRESQDKNYIANYCNVDADNVIIIKNGALSEGNNLDKALYDDMIETISITDCAIKENYDFVNELIDVDSYTSYLAGGLYIECVDWLNISNNFTLWRVRETGNGLQEDGRWRWVYQDLDYSCGWGHSDPTPVQLLLREKIFSSLWTSEEYRDLFLTRIMDIGNIDCAMPRVNAILDRFSEYYRMYTPGNYARFYAENSIKQFDEQVESIRTFFKNRPAQIVSQLKKALHMDRDAHTLTIGSNLPEQDSLMVNGRGIALEKGSWEGLYFEGCPIIVCAGDIIGYEFLGWYDDEQLVYGDDMVTVELRENISLTARYQKKPTIIDSSAEHPPKLIRKEIALFSGLWSYDGKLIPDSKIAANLDTDAGIVTLLPNEDAWAKKSGFEFVFETVKHRDVSFTIAIEKGEELAEKWLVSASTDGEQYEKVQELRLSVGANTLEIALPEKFEDLCEVHLRFEAASKSSKKKNDDLSEYELVIKAVSVFGEPCETTLAAYKQCVLLCEKELGSRFETPDLSLILTLSQNEINERVAVLYEELASALIADASGTVSQKLPDEPMLEGLGDYTCAVVSERAPAYSYTVYVDLDETLYKKEVYAYRWTGDGMEYIDMLPVRDGRVSMTAMEGMYVLLDRPLDELRYTVDFINDAVKNRTMKELLFGITPSAYQWMNLTLKTVYQEVIRFAVPENSGIDLDSLWMYRFESGWFTDEMMVKKDPDGLFTLAASTPGGQYLLLSQSIEDIRLESEYISQYLAPAAVSAQDEKDKQTIYFAALLTLMMTAVITQSVR